MLEPIALLSFLALGISLTCTVLLVMWLKRMRQSVREALAEMNARQLEYVQKLTDAVLDLQQRHKSSEGNLASLAQANMKMRGELAAIHDRLSRQNGEDNDRPSDRFLH